MKALVLAAGRGSRLAGYHNAPTKCLLSLSRYGSSNILDSRCNAALKCVSLHIECHRRTNSLSNKLIDGVGSDLGVLIEYEEVIGGLYNQGWKTICM